MPALRRDQPQGEELVFREARIELAARDVVCGVLGPLHKVVHGLLRAVAVVGLERVALGLDVGLRDCQGLRRLIGEPALGCVVPGDGPAHEVVLAVVADLLHDVGSGVREAREAGGQLGRLAAAAGEGEHRSQHDEGSGDGVHGNIVGARRS